MLLVVAVVAAGAVRAGHPELELLLVEGRPVDVDPRLPHDDDAAAVARQADGELERVGGGGRGAQEHCVEAEPARDGVDARLERRRRRAGSRSRRPGGRARPRRRRGRCRPRGTPRRRGAAPRAARRARARSRRPSSPSRDLGLADAVQRDRADGRVRGVLERDAVGDRRDEVPRHGEDLGVVRALAAAGDAVAGRDALDALRRPRARPRRTSSRSARAPRAGRAPCRPRSGSPRRAPCPRPSCTRSGRARAFWSRFFSPVTIFVRSVPALISEQRFATSSQPRRSAGAGRRRRDGRRLVRVVQPASRRRLVHTRLRQLPHDPHVTECHAVTPDRSS